jgi:hypothetical protein
MPVYFSDAEEEVVTITTYYPSPYGVYKNLRLYETTEPTPSTGREKGVMYFDQNTNTIRYYNGNKWVNLTETPCQKFEFTGGSVDTYCDEGYFTNSFAPASTTGGNVVCCKVENP